MIVLGVAGVSLAIWLVLVFARDGFWLTRERDGPVTPDLIRGPCEPAAEPNDRRGGEGLAWMPGQARHDGKGWPSVIAIVPARDEAEVIARSIGSLAAQDYPGDFRIVLVDDSSSDGTADIARALGSERLSVVQGAPLAPGWTGKLWAVSQGIAAAGDAPDYLLLTDADIAHAPDTLRSLVARAVDDDRVLVSLMARLRCESLAERALIPAFVWFFQMLYPFATVNRRGRGLGAAAGGVMLVERRALEAAGGIAAVRSALIDDCAFGALLKTQGAIWLGLTDRAKSIRRYDTWGSVAAMISRSAYAQLHYSPLLLAGTTLGLALTYLAPPVLAIAARGPAQYAAIAAWALMALAFQPMVRFYRRSPLWGLLLPAIATFYAGCTLLSAWQHVRGRGGLWKGRVQADLAGMSGAADLASGKGHKDENFPVASVLLKPEHRAPVMAFYRFARGADDVADNPAVSADEKLALLGAMRATILGTRDADAASVALRTTMEAHRISPQHALDLLTAFERDCTVNRCADWAALIDYCRYSAMPVGRYVLDVHGEDQATWPASDALCAALQVINHTQDCAKDYRAIGRVYLPLDLMAQHGARLDDLEKPVATPGLLATIRDLAARSQHLLDESAGFAGQIHDRRLAVEVAIIHRLAVSLTQRLKTRDPLSQRVHHRPYEALGLAALAAVSQTVKGAGMNPKATPAQLQAQVSGSSFYAGMRVLPKVQREAMYAVYAFCREVDDIADDEIGDRPARMAALDAWRADIESLYAGGNPGRAALVAEAVRRFALDKADFLAVIDGMAMDVDRDIRWPSMAELELYCDRVASAVGRLSVKIFGMEDAVGIALAHHLGLALQFTNILRDVDEDAGIGRVYLPREALLAAGVELLDPITVVGDPRVDAAARVLAAKAHTHFAAAQAILDARPRGHLIAPRLMAAVYAPILVRMEAIGWAPPRTRIKVNKPALIFTVLRLMLFR